MKKRKNILALGQPSFSCLHWHPLLGKLPRSLRRPSLDVLSRCPLAMLILRVTNRGFLYTVPVNTLVFKCISFHIFFTVSRVSPICQAGPFSTGDQTPPERAVRSTAIPISTHWIETFSHPGLLASLLGARMLLGAPGLTTRSKKPLGAPGIATRSKDATRGSWPYY